MLDTVRPFLPPILTSVLLLVVVLAVSSLTGCSALGELPLETLADRGPFAGCVASEVDGSLQLDVVKPAILGACSGELDVDFADCRDRFGASTPLDANAATFIQGGVNVAVGTAAAVVGRYGDARANEWAVALRPSIARLGEQAVEEASPLGDAHLVIPWQAPHVGACR